MNTLVIEIIKDVFDKEISGLIKAKETIVGDFEKVLSLLKNCNGKIIFNGIGKSGSIAKKISSTFLSIGLKSLFIHPVESLHGDIGILEENDCFVMISKSGETDELINMIPYIKNFKAKIILITSNKNSILTQLSDFVISLTFGEEACPFNVIPTTSTTAFLVVGDALAIALMKIRNIKENDLIKFHPGGSIGKKLYFRIKDLMWSDEDNPIVYLDDDLKIILEEMTKYRLGAVSVIDDDGYFCGLITDFDIRVHILNNSENAFSLKAKDIMNKNPKTIYEDKSALEALMIMEGEEKQLNILPVIDSERKVVGIIRLHDLVRNGLLDIRKRQK